MKRQTRKWGNGPIFAIYILGYGYNKKCYFLTPSKKKKDRKEEGIVKAP